MGDERADQPAVQAESAEGVGKRVPLPLLIGGIGIFGVLTVTGTALSPTLLVEQPLVLVAMNPVWRHQMLVSPVTDALIYFPIVIARLLITDPLYFLLGRDYRDDAVKWMRRQSGRSLRTVNWLEGAFQKAGPLLVFLAPVGLVCLLAGAARMKVPKFAVLNVLGTIFGVTIVRYFGKSLEGPISIFTDFVSEHKALLTLVTVLFVMASSAMRVKRMPRGSSDSDVD